MEIVNLEIEQYMRHLAREPDPVIQEMESYAEKNGFPIIGPLVGRVLCQLALVSGARRILELGSGFGYSAFWFSRAMGEEGEIILTEFRRENLDRARSYLTRAGLRSTFHFRQGDALQTADSVDGPFDIILIDLDKHQYPAALDKALPKLRPGGIAIADNTLWSGRVLDAETADRDTRGILEYNERVFSDPSLVTSILPIRDGVAVSVKIS